MDDTRQIRRAAQRAALHRRPPQVYQHAHEMVAHTAREFAGAFYEDAAHDDAFYRHFPDQATFIAAEWHTFIPKARAVLASMLARDYPDKVKSQIHDALVLDRSLPRPDNYLG